MLAAPCPVGFALTNRSRWRLAALLVVAINPHLPGLVEEEHLRRTLGDRYLTFYREVPPYATWWQYLLDGMGPRKA